MRVYSLLQFLFWLMTQLRRRLAKRDPEINYSAMITSYVDFAPFNYGRSQPRILSIEFDGSRGCGKTTSLIVVAAGLLRAGIPVILRSRLNNFEFLKSQILKELKQQPAINLKSDKLNRILPVILYDCGQPSFREFQVSRYAA